MNDLIVSPLASNNIEFLPTGLYIAPNTGYDEWHNIGVVLQFLASMLEFAIGDWINYGEANYGEKYSQAIAETGKPYGTLTNYAYVAGKVDISRRRENLSFSHHAEVAKLDVNQQEVYLETAAKECLSVRELRARIKGNGNTAYANHCPNCGHEW